MSNTLTIGIPKGSLEKSTLELFAKCGFRFYGSERSFRLDSSDPEIKPILLRPQEIPMYVRDGSLDCGLAGWDWIVESKCNGQIKMLADLNYSKRSFSSVRWVLAVAEDSEIESVSDFQGRNPAVRIATELKSVTEDWLSVKGIIANVQFSWGATEAKVPTFADAIVDCSETGSTLRSNGLRVIDTVIESTTRFFGNKAECARNEWKLAKLKGIALLLKSCLAAETKVNIHLRVPVSQKDAIVSALPSSATCTAWKGESDLMIYEIIVDREEARSLVPLFAEIGAQKISVGSLGMLYEYP